MFFWHGGPRGVFAEGMDVFSLNKGDTLLQFSIWFCIYFCQGILRKREEKALAYGNIEQLPRGWKAA